MLLRFLSPKIFLIASLICTPLICLVLLNAFKRFLPVDHGREYAVNGMKSAGKARGAGVIFISSFIVTSVLFVSAEVEYLIFYALIFLSMLSGYLDDRSEKPWGEYKKGIIDLVLSAGVAGAFIFFNPELTAISFFGKSFTLNKIVFGILAALLCWALINAVNCSDGIDGYCGSLSGISILSTGAIIFLTPRSDRTAVLLAFSMLLTLVPYLWKNAEPSSMMMGDAGSRAIGLLLCILILKTGNILLVVPLCFMLCLDGLLGIVKIVTIRFLHINPLKKIRTPLHDHLRKNMGWSNSQVILRTVMLQCAASALAVLAKTMG